MRLAGLSRLTVVGVAAVLTWTLAPNPSEAFAYFRCAEHRWAWPGTSFPAAQAQLCVGNNHLKTIGVADNRVDGRGLAIEIDPTGPGDPLVYYDPDEYGDTNYSHDIHYVVRKWRFVSVQAATGTVDGVLPWQSKPLPYPDY